jgi:hypothetical protein
VNGQTLVEEHEVVPASPGTRYISASSPRFDILPLHYHPPLGAASSTGNNTKSADDDISPPCAIPCRIGGAVLLLLLIFQTRLWYMMMSGNDVDTFHDLFEKFHGQ